MPTLGYLPAGTTNDFSKTLKLPADLLKSARIAVGGQSQPLRPGGSSTARPFVYVAAFGVFSEVSYATPQSSKNALGHLAYVLGGIKRPDPAAALHHEGDPRQGRPSRGLYLWHGVRLHLRGGLSGASRRRT